MSLETRGRGGVALPLACALLALLVRLPVFPTPESAGPWIRGSLALQGSKAPGDAGEARTDLTVAIPLLVGQNLGFVASRVGGETGGQNAAAWIVRHEAYSRRLLWLFWSIAGAAAAFLAATYGSRPSQADRWGILAGAAAAIVPVGVSGTEQLEGWAVASAFALLAFSAERWKFLVPAWAFVLSLTPVGLVVAAAALVAGGRRHRLAILLAVPVWFALDPARLTAPGAAIGSVWMDLRAAGWPGIGAGPFGRLLVASWSPGLVPLLLILVVAASAARKPALRGPLLAILLLWIAPAALGARRADAVGLAAPLALVLASGGARVLAQRAVRVRALVSAVLIAAVLLPIGAAEVGTLRAQSRRRERTVDLGRVLADQVGQSGLLVRDPLAPSVPESIACFTLPMNVAHPEVWDFAYWPGWYGSFTHVLMTERTIESIENDLASRPLGHAFLVGLVRHADAVCRFGDPATDRSALILFRLRPDPPWVPKDPNKVWDSIQGGKTEALFLSDLGGFLSVHGHAQRGLDILRLALRWEDSDPGLYNNLGTALLVLGEWKDAAQAFADGLRRDPSSVELRYGMARAYLAGGVPGRAEVELRKVVAMRPSFAEAHYELARAAAAAGDWPLAAQALEAYLSHMPNPRNRDQIESALAEARRRALAKP